MKTIPERSDLSDQNVADLIDCAGYGINYWASTADLDTEKKTYTVSWSEGDDEPNETRTVSYDDLRDAFVKLGEEEKLPEWQLRELRENDLCFDATVGDMVVQYAVFDKLVFG